jgi:hypothetical protein
VFSVKGQPEYVKRPCAQPKRKSLASVSTDPAKKVQDKTGHVRESRAASLAQDSFVDRLIVRHQRRVGRAAEVAQISSPVREAQFVCVRGVDRRTSAQRSAQSTAQHSTAQTALEEDQPRSEGSVRGGEGRVSRRSVAQRQQEAAKQPAPKASDHATVPPGRKAELPARITQAIAPLVPSGTDRCHRYRATLTAQLPLTAVREAQHDHSRERSAAKEAGA